MAAAVDTGHFKVPKDRAIIEVKAPPLAPERRKIFLSPCAESHQGRETVSDIFNTSLSFLPLLDESESIILVRREAVHWVRIEDPAKVEWYYYDIRQGSPHGRARFGFRDSESLEGAVYAIGPAGEQRIQDVVNRTHGFLHLDTEAGLYLVNLGEVVRISVLEKADAGP